jgi:hypothetical protein
LVLPPKSNPPDSIAKQVQRATRRGGGDELGIIALSAANPSPAGGDGEDEEQANPRNRNRILPSLSLSLSLDTEEEGTEEKEIDREMLILVDGRKCPQLLGP